MHFAFDCVGEVAAPEKGRLLSNIHAALLGGLVRAVASLWVLCETQAGSQLFAYLSQILSLAGFDCILQHSSCCRAREVAAGFDGWEFSTSHALN